MKIRHYFCTVLLSSVGIVLASSANAVDEAMFVATDEWRLFGQSEDEQVSVKGVRKKGNEYRFWTKFERLVVPGCDPSVSRSTWDQMTCGERRSTVAQTTLIEYGVNCGTSQIKRISYTAYNFHRQLMPAQSTDEGWVSIIPGSLGETLMLEMCRPK